MELADATVDILNIVAPLALGGLGMTCVLVIIFTRHQQRMAALIHGRATDRDELAGEVRALKSEVQRLAGIVEPLAPELPKLLYGSGNGAAEPNQTPDGCNEFSWIRKVHNIGSAR